MSVGIRGGSESDAALAGTSGVTHVAVLARGGKHIDGAWLAAVVARHSRVGLAIKRSVDVALAAVGLLVASPLLLVLAAIIRLDSGGQGFFRQSRVGRGQRGFTLTKLRTMHADGTVTRVGRLLRPTGIDELPQLWNVLKGDMTLVGPRPEEPHLVERYDANFPGYRLRHLMRPGITGWAQVNGLRGHVSIAERLSFDLRYLRSWSLALDVRILLRTVSTVWRDSRRAWRS